MTITNLQLIHAHIFSWLALILITTGGKFAIAQIALSNSPAPASSGNQLEEIRFKLKTLGRAVLMHRDVMRGLPPPRDRAGAVVGPGLSWRVHLLPFVGEHELYEEFHFDEPWDSPHNTKLSDRMPDIYRLAGGRDSSTRFRVFAGPDILFGSKLGFRDLHDGDRHTILLIVAASELATPWTKPDELSMENIDLAKFRVFATTTSIECVMADGQPLTIPGDVEPKTFVALITPRGGELIDAEAIRRRTTAVGTSSTTTPTPAPNNVSKKLRDIGLAMHSYHDANRCFPIRNQPDYFDEQGKPKLSWRVHLLPFLKQEPLYGRFQLNEPWDSPHNRELLQYMPEIYRDDGPVTATRFITMNGEFALFGNKQATTMHDAEDGGNTVLVIQAGKDKAIPWTKPDDNYFDPTQPFECVGKIEPSGLACVMVDGRVWVFRPSLPAELFSALVTPKGKELINDSELRSAEIR